MDYLEQIDKMFRKITAAFAFSAILGLNNVSKAGIMFTVSNQSFM